MTCDRTSKVTIQRDSDHPVLEYAVGELKWILEDTTSLQLADNADRPDIVFHLGTSPDLPPAAFELAAVAGGGGETREVFLKGQDAAATLAAVYTFLESAGVYFDIAGPRLPEILDLDRALTKAGEGWRVIPAVRKRGIRQHINFPMDISSYTLSEACEYIRNLARLRFNHITFHSYARQWYACALSTGELLANRCFYGVRYDVPDDTVVGPALRNRQVFCIPELEPVYDRPEELSRGAIAWLRGLMAEAARAGMHVQFSLEAPRGTILDGVIACEAVLDAYPDIHTLELITPENKHQTESHLEHYLSILATLRADRASLPALAVGIYETGPEHLRLGLEFLRKNCPPDIEWSFLPSHGGRAAVENMRELGLIPDEWERSMFYSWIEFDGLMYNQQNSLLASQQAVELALNEGGGGSVAGLSFNHWRTMENRAAINYAARVCIDHTLTPGDFCREYGAAYTIGKLDSLTKGMTVLDETDAYCRDRLFNIGFCHLSCWRNKPGLGWTRKFTLPNLEEACCRLDGAKSLLAEALAATATVSGRQLLRFLINRIECTILHFQVIAALVELHPVCEDARPEKIDADGRKRVRTQCDLARVLAGQYLKHHADMLPDRGCEGTLVNYHDTLPVYIEHVRNYFLEREDVSLYPETQEDDHPPAPEGVHAAMVEQADRTSSR